MVPSISDGRYGLMVFDLEHRHLLANHLYLIRSAVLQETPVIPPLRSMVLSVVRKHLLVPLCPFSAPCRQGARRTTYLPHRRDNIVRAAAERVDPRLVLGLHARIARLVLWTGRHRDRGVVREVRVEHRAHVVAPQALERAHEARDLRAAVQVPEELAERRSVAHRRRKPVRRSALLRAW